MRALMCKEHGPAEKLVIEEVADPSAGPGEVVIDIKAAGLNFPDVLTIQGLYQAKNTFPFTPGVEASGVISSVGEGVSSVALGDRVIASMMGGAFAEKAVASAHTVVAMPDSMGFPTGAGLTTTYSTSYHALKQRANLQSGETLLVLGAAGGVGLSAVELGRLMGAHVIAAASTDEKLETTRAFGADACINYTKEDLKTRVKELTGKKGADVVYDPVGGDYCEQALRATNWDGRYLVIGFASGNIPRIPLNLPLLKGSHIVGVFWGAWAARNPQGHRKNFGELLDLFVEGRIKPLVSETYALDNYLDAFNCLTERRAKGKVIFTFE